MEQVNCEQRQWNELLGAIKDYFRLFDSPNSKKHSGKHKFDNIHETPGEHPCFTCSICDSLYASARSRLDAAIAIWEGR